MVPFKSLKFGALPYMTQTCTLNTLEKKYLESLEMWCWMRMEKIKWSKEVNNKQDLERIGEKRTLK